MDRVLVRCTQRGERVDQGRLSWGKDGEFGHRWDGSKRGVRTKCAEDHCTGIDTETVDAHLGWRCAMDGVLVSGKSIVSLGYSEEEEGLGKQGTYR